MHLQVVNYILYGNGKPIRGISDTSIQLVRTYLVLNWYQEKKKFSYRKDPCFLYGSKDKWSDSRFPNSLDLYDIRYYAS